MSQTGYAGVISQSDVRQIITTDDPKLLVEQAEHAGAKLADQGLTKSQIRNIFGTVRRLQLNWSPSLEGADKRARVRELLLLKPKLAYQAARQAKVKPLADVLDLAIDHVVAGDPAVKEPAEPASEQGTSGVPVDQDRVRFQRFVELFEAILAYHTKYGGH